MYLPILALTLGTSGAALAQPTVHIPADAATLSAALRLVDDGGTILVAEGNDTLSEPCVEISKGVTLRGEGDHPEITGIFSRDQTINLDNLTLAGVCTESTSAGNLSRHVDAHLIVYGGAVTGTNLGIAAHVGVGVVVSDSTAAFTGVVAQGMSGGPVFFAEVYQASTSLEIREAELHDNEAGVVGGQRYANTDPALTVSLIDSSLTNNSDTQASVAWLYHGDLHVEDSVLAGTGSDGGGATVPSHGLIWVTDGAVSITGAEIRDCLGVNAGAVHAEGSPENLTDNVNITDTTITDCGAEISVGYGGLVYAVDASVTITNVLATRVFATAGALVKHEYSGSLSVKAVTVSTYRTEYGGAIYANESEALAVTRVHLCDADTVYDNNNTGVQTYLVGQTIIQNLVAHGMVAVEGSIIKSTAGILELRNSTFAGNTVHDLVITENDELTLFNNIFSHSPGATGVTFWSVPASWTGGYNLWSSLSVPVYGFDDFEDPATDLSIDPMFSQDWVESDCATLPYLAEGSPAIDAGNPDPTYNDTDGTRGDIGALGGPQGDWSEPGDSDTPASSSELHLQLSGGFSGCATAPGPRPWWALLGVLGLLRASRR